MGAVNALDYERLARGRLEEGVFGYFAGGAGDERTLAENVAAFARVRFRPRVLVDVSRIDTSTTVLGTPVSMPIPVAPVALQRLLAPDGEVATARAAAAAGTIFTLSTIATSSPSEVADGAPGGARWMQVYVCSDRGITRAIVDEAKANGFSALALTVDAQRAGRRERDQHTGFAVPAGVRVPPVAMAMGAGASPTVAEMFSLFDRSLCWEDVAELVSDSGLPVALKGIQTAEDARLAVEHGAAAIIVSNHGGRQLDDVAPTLELLEEVLEAVDGRVEVLLDGGVRRGTDALKAIALGARAVLCGRAPIWGLAVAGEDGVSDVLAIMREELELGMTLLGTPTLADVTRAHVSRS